MPGSGQSRQRNITRTAWAGIIGSVVEYYDFTLFGLAAALVFGPLFFPSADPTTQVISSLLTFAIGYFGRPNRRAAVQPLRRPRRT
ncbi:hypothetical protein GCM10009551_074250 [Nocardiopsis tropica]|uniref:hypothetical protein n=1 Tax=Tsukamurella strandjordii TaxID=147577 RepID=UPI0031D04222